MSRKLSRNGMFEREQFQQKMIKRANEELDEEAGRVLTNFAEFLKRRPWQAMEIAELLKESLEK
jgi:hypothetical protein